MDCGGAGVGVPLPARGDPLLHPRLQHRHQVRALTFVQGVQQTKARAVLTVLAGRPGRYNMVENGFSHRTGFLWGVLFPWVAALPLLYQPNALNQFINFSSLVFVSFTDFIVPCEPPCDGPTSSLLRLLSFAVPIS